MRPHDAICTSIYTTYNGVKVKVLHIIYSRQTPLSYLNHVPCLAKDKGFCIVMRHMPEGAHLRTICTQWWTIESCPVAQTPTGVRLDPRYCGTRIPLGTPSFPHSRLCLALHLYHTPCKRTNSPSAAQFMITKFGELGARVSLGVWVHTLVLRENVVQVWHSIGHNMSPPPSPLSLIMQ